MDNVEVVWNILRSKTQQSVIIIAESENIEVEKQVLRDFVNLACAAKMIHGVPAPNALVPKHEPALQISVAMALDFKDSTDVNNFIRFMKLYFKNGSS